LVFASNPAYTLPDGGAFLKALKKIPFIVSFSPFKDETAMMADLILPDHTSLEKIEDVVQPVGLQYPMLGLSRPVIRPVYSTRHAGDAVVAIAKALGSPVSDAFPWKGFEAALKERVEGLVDVAGLTSFDEATPPWEAFARGRYVESDYKDADELWDKLRSRGFWYRPSHEFYDWFNCFKTPSGKFELACSRIEEALKESSRRSLGIEARGDEAAMPHYESEGPEPAKDSLVLVPYELFNVSTGWLPNPPFLTKTLFDHQLRKDESFVEMNPETAVQFGLAEGDRVRLESESGNVEARVHLFEGAMPGCAYLPVGFGHTAYGIYQKGKGVNAMKVVTPESDPISGHKVWWRTQVKVRKA
jgi:anaerobic selenocysteine-containing dehydrogenase